MKGSFGTNLNTVIIPVSKLVSTPKSQVVDLQVEIPLVHTNTIMQDLQRNQRSLIDVEEHLTMPPVQIRANQSYSLLNTALQESIKLQ